MRDCVEELGASVDELQTSIADMGSGGGKDFGLRMSDIQTWVSAAVTGEDTCMNGFSGINVKATVRTHILNIAHIRSNALALVNSYAANQNMS
ncbi:21 kDa protein-like [Melia azedarach]|uniref:21 kDa protein-like n=1 Tax=Melia azedarach TaxID=155640 RepID=A0ACC1XNN0_MELAZ|nr:21 kDa protein-like [Melia azedarach]